MSSSRTKVFFWRDGSRRRHSLGPCSCWLRLVNKRERFELRALIYLSSGRSFAVVLLWCGDESFELQLDVEVSAER